MGIAQAIIHDPPVIILDEPTVGLDPRQIIEVRNLIKSLAKEKTIILSTHILPEVTMTCDTVTIINQGMVIATGKTEELLQQLNNKGYHLEVEGEVNGLTSKLKKIEAIDKIIIEPITGIDNRFIIKLSLKNDSEVGKEIASMLVHEGVGIYEMRRLKASLEEVFLQLTTQENISVNN